MTGTLEIVARLLGGETAVWRRRGGRRAPVDNVDRKAQAARGGTAARVALLIVLTAIGGQALGSGEVAAQAEPQCISCENPPPPDRSLVGPGATTTVLISPGTETFRGVEPSRSVNVEIAFCSTGGSLPANGHRIYLDGAEITARFSTATQSGASGCSARLVAHGQLVLTPGEHRVHASIPDGRGVASDAVSYTYSYAHRGVAVSPDRATVAANPGSGTNYLFTVRNLGTATDTFAIQFQCAGPFFDCGPASRTVVLGPGSATEVTAYFNRRSDPADGIVTVRASGVSAPAVQDEGSVSVAGSGQGGSESAPSIGQWDPVARRSEAGPNPELTPTPSLCFTMPAVGGADYQCGDLRLAHALPTVRTLGRAWTPALVYNSQHAQPTPLVRAYVTRPPDAATASRVEARVLTLDGVELVRRSYEPREWAPSMTRQIALGWSDPALPTGFHRYLLEVTFWYGSTARSAQMAVTVGVVNRVSSPYGRGWWLAGLEQLDPGSMTWVGGDGAMRAYTPVAGHDGVWVASTVTHADTLIRRGQGGYARLLPGGARSYFDAAGRHVATADALGRFTQFVYAPTIFTPGMISAIRVPTRVGIDSLGARIGTDHNTGVRSHSFTWIQQGGQNILYAADSYDENNAFTRRTRLGYDQGDNRVTSITNPDQSRVEFGYGASAPGRIARRQDPLRAPITWLYNEAGKLIEGRSDPGRGAAPVVVSWDPAESRGWQSSTTHTTTRIDGPRMDARDITEVALNALGAPRRIIDPLGNATEFTYSSAYPAVVVSTRGPAGQVSAVRLDALGRVVELTDSASWKDVGGRRIYAGTTYAYEDPRNPTRPTRVTTRDTTPEGITSRTGYNANGTVQWSQDPRGDSTRVSFTYDGRGLLETIRPVRDSVLGRAPARLDYDNLGNLREHRTPEGVVTTYRRDQLGRVMRTLRPALPSELASADQPYTQVTYDVMDRVRTTEQWGPDVAIRIDQPAPLLAVPQQRLWVQNSYDAAGQLESVARWGEGEGSAQIGRIVTRWEYDLLGRAVREVASDGNAEVRVYDPAGNAVAVSTRRGYTSTTEFDALNRMTRRITPEVSYSPAISRVDNETTWVYPLFAQEGPGVFSTAQNSRLGGGVTIAPDTAEFGYDEFGNLVRANNRDARITREYNHNGSLRSETQRIRTYLHGSTDQGFGRAYTIRYDYDLQGRVTHIHHPANLRPAEGTGTARYWYGAHGAVDSVGSAADGMYRFRYDAVGALVESTGRGSEQYEYDADGRAIRRLHMYSSAVLHDDEIRYNAQGTVHDVVSLEHGANPGSTERFVYKYRYGGLGGLIYSARLSDREVERSMEVNRLDAFANPLRREMYSFNQVENKSTARAEGFAYEAGTGRQVGRSSEENVRTDVTRYDESGNAFATFTQRTIQTPYPSTASGFLGGETGPVRAVLQEGTLSYYGADEKLRVVDKRTCLLFGLNRTCRADRPAPYNGRSAFEEYRYDALGRRVLTRTRAAWGCTSNCLNAVIRTVWSGDQILYEISAPGARNHAEMEVDDPPTPVVAERSVNQGFFAYGRVAYTHAHGIDAPLSVTRIGYSNIFPGAVEVEPFVNWNGKYDGGARPCAQFTDPGDTRIAPVVWAPGEREERDEETESSEGRVFYHCVEADWPARVMYNSLERRDEQRSNWEGPSSWMGSLILHGRDASGRYYRRNRYYDPATGGFTQEDPIGLAGGINLYGYANGNPVGYSDPYGLCPDRAAIGRMLTLFCLASEGHFDSAKPVTPVGNDIHAEQQVVDPDGPFRGEVAGKESSTTRSGATHEGGGNPDPRHSPPEGATRRPKPRTTGRPSQVRGGPRTVMRGSTMLPRGFVLLDFIGAYQAMRTYDPCAVHGRGSSECLRQPPRID